MKRFGRANFSLGKGELARSLYSICTSWRTACRRTMKTANYYSSIVAKALICVLVVNLIFPVSIFARSGRGGGGSLGRVFGSAVGSFMAGAKAGGVFQSNFNLGPDYLVRDNIVVTPGSSLNSLHTAAQTASLSTVNTAAGASSSFSLGETISNGFSSLADTLGLSTNQVWTPAQSWGTAIGTSTGNLAGAFSYMKGYSPSQSAIFGGLTSGFTGGLTTGYFGGLDASAMFKHTAISTVQGGVTRYTAYKLQDAGIHPAMASAVSSLTGRTLGQAMANVAFDPSDAGKGEVWTWADAAKGSVADVFTDEAPRILTSAAVHWAVAEAAGYDHKARDRDDIFKNQVADAFGSYAGGIAGNYVGARTSHSRAKPVALDNGNTLRTSDGTYTITSSSTQTGTYDYKLVDRYGKSVREESGLSLAELGSVTKGTFTVNDTTHQLAHKRDFNFPMKQALGSGAITAVTKAGLAYVTKGISEPGLSGLADITLGAIGTSIGRSMLEDKDLEADVTAEFAKTGVPSQQDFSVLSTFPQEQGSDLAKDWGHTFVQAGMQTAPSFTDAIAFDQYDIFNGNPAMNYVRNVDAVASMAQTVGRGMSGVQVLARNFDSAAYQTSSSNMGNIWSKVASGNWYQVNAHLPTQGIQRVLINKDEIRFDRGGQFDKSDTKTVTLLKDYASNEKFDSMKEMDPERVLLGVGRMPSVSLTYRDAWGDRPLFQTHLHQDTDQWVPQRLERNFDTIFARTSMDIQEATGEILSAAEDKALAEIMRKGLTQPGRKWTIAAGTKLGSIGNGRVDKLWSAEYTDEATFADLGHYNGKLEFYQYDTKGRLETTSSYDGRSFEEGTYDKDGTYTAGKFKDGDFSLADLTERLITDPNLMNRSIRTQHYDKEGNLNALVLDRQAHSGPETKYHNFAPQHYTAVKRQSESKKVHPQVRKRAQEQLDTFKKMNLAVDDTTHAKIVYDEQGRSRPLFTEGTVTARVTGELADKFSEPFTKKLNFAQDSQTAAVIIQSKDKTGKNFLFPGFSQVTTPDGQAQPFVYREGFSNTYQPYTVKSHGAYDWKQESGSGYFDRNPIPLKSFGIDIDKAPNTIVGDK